jgi:predicted small lipoprotein YifL
MFELFRKSLSTRLAGVAVMVAVALVAGCGQKGPLTLPKPAKPAVGTGPAPAASAPAVPR